MNIASNVNILADWLNAHPAMAGVLIVWSLIWKGFALWKSAGLRQKYWFMVMLVLNTMGILEIIYLFAVARKYKVEVVEN